MLNVTIRTTSVNHEHRLKISCFRESEAKCATCGTGNIGRQIYAIISNEPATSAHTQKVSQAISDSCCLIARLGAIVQLYHYATYQPGGSRERKNPPSFAPQVIQVKLKSTSQLVWELFQLGRIITNEQISGRNGARLRKVIALQ